MEIKFDPSFFENPELDGMAKQNGKTKAELIEAFQLAASMANASGEQDHEKLMLLFSEEFSKLMGGKGEPGTIAPLDDPVEVESAMVAWEQQQALLQARKDKNRG